jgi:hypothetical protein
MSTDYITLGLYDICTFLNEPTHFQMQLLENKFLRSVVSSGVCFSALIPAVAEYPELIRLKCANHHLEGDPG